MQFITVPKPVFTDNWGKSVLLANIIQNMLFVTVSSCNIVRHSQALRELHGVDSVRVLWAICAYGAKCSCSTSVQPISKECKHHVAITPRGNLTLRPLSGIHCNSILDFNIFYMKIIGNLYMAILNTRKITTPIYEASELLA